MSTFKSLAVELIHIILHLAAKSLHNILYLAVKSLSISNKYLLHDINSQI